MKDVPEPAVPRQSHDEWVKGEFRRFFSEIYGARRFLFAVAVVICFAFLFLQGCWTERRSIDNMRRIERIERAINP